MAGGLPREWARAYPEFFDEDDLRLATGPQGEAGFHFWEWLAAVVLHHATGYHPLWNYEYGGHKHAILQRLSDQLRAAIADHTKHGGTLPPDLLMYAPDYSDWFFCEVKGAGDR